MEGSVASKSELLNVIADVKARVQGKLGIIDLPMPQFILLGKQSVGKSRLIESLAGEQFNFCSGSLGSRRPTVLEFRHNAGMKVSRWSVRDQKTNQWAEMPLAQVQQVIGEAHESLGATVSAEAVYVRVESPFCVDMQIVDLPGFRDFAADARKTDLAAKIETLVETFMKDRRNVMICVEQANDAATMSTLQRCRHIDPSFSRTILVRNKLDKYYTDLTADNVNKWVDGFGDLPANLVRFSLTLPWWQDGMPCPKPFPQLREEMDKTDVSTMQAKGMAIRYMQTIGFTNFAAYMERRIEKMFVDSLGPVLATLKGLKDTTEKKERDLTAEFHDTDPHQLLSTTRECGSSFATALTHVMEGVYHLTEGRMTLAEELTKFHEHHKAVGTESFSLLPSEDFATLPEYLAYLKGGADIGAFDIPVNGGAQFSRLMTEVEVFLRFSEINVETKQRDVFQALGVSLSPLTWRDVIVKILANEAHLPLQRRVRYVGERIRWFFEKQKVAVVDFMENLEGMAQQNCYSPLYPKHAKLIKSNDMIKQLVFETYDRACDRNMQMFIQLFDNMLTSMFANPWISIKNTTVSTSNDEDFWEATLPSFDDTKERVPREIKTRLGIEASLNERMQEIPTNDRQMGESVDKVQRLVLRTYSLIRSQVCDQVELFSESVFKLPMLQQLKKDMSQMDISEQDKAHYEARRGRLSEEVRVCQRSIKELDACISRLQTFMLKCAAQKR